MVVVYGLADPGSGQLRYIGCTSQPLHRRFVAHRWGGARAVWAWLRDNPGAEIVPIAECADLAEGLAVEAEHVALLDDLLNVHGRRRHALRAEP